MHESSDVTDAWLRFCLGVTQGRADQFDDIVSKGATSIIGTAPGETVTDGAGMRFGFETEGITLMSRRAVGFEEGTLGWVTDQPRLGLSDGSGMDWRVTAVVRKEDRTWRLLHAHFSVGVPDDEVLGLQERWSPRVDLT